MADSELRAFDALATHARLSDLVTITRAVATTAAEGRKADWTDAAKVKLLAEEAKLEPEEAKTDFGNALAVLERGVEDEAERALACALWAHALAESPPKGRDDEDRVADDVLWLATHTPFDATRLVDRALGDGASDLWDAIADRVRKIDRGKVPTLTRGEALVGAAALSSSSSESARKHATALVDDVKDQALARVLALRPVEDEKAVITGDMIIAPRGPAVTTLLALTGLLFAVHAVRLLARFALAYKAPAELTVTAAGVRVKTHSELLGRTVRERELVIARSQLVRATREVRYPRIGFYAGLLALAVGSYLGVATLFDGVRAASPSLLLTGLLIVAAGVLLEMVLSSLEPGAVGRSRMLFVPVRGPTVCVAGVDPKRADAALTLLLSKK
jgi:hypothetical protein